MDLENELRQAMAEHVTEVSAPRTLAADAKHRHHRTVRRRTAIVVGAAGVVVAVSMIPAYQSIHSQPVGADGSSGRKHGQNATGTPSTVPSPALTPRPNLPSGPKGSHSPKKPKRTTGSLGPDLGLAKSLLGYLPQGLVPAEKTCETSHAGSKEITTCRWTGSGSWVEVRLIRGSGLKSPSDLGLAPPLSQPVTVQGHSGLRSDSSPAFGSQVMWIERKGLGVWVGVSPSLRDSLTRVAKGVNVS
jgi:hypothetical protein